MVESPGILTGMVRVNNIREFHFSRNPKIVELLGVYDFVKEFGEGVDRIYREMDAAGLPEPVYRQTDFMLFAELRNKFFGSDGTTWKNDNNLEWGIELSDKLSDNLSDSLSDNEKRTLALLLENPEYTTQQMADRLSVSRVSVTKYLKALKENELIERVGSDRKGYWKIVVKQAE